MRAVALGRATSVSHPNTPSMIQRGWSEISRTIFRATSSFRFEPRPPSSQCSRSRSIAGIWARLAMAWANVLFPEPLFPITAVRSVRGSGIQSADGWFLSYCRITLRLSLSTWHCQTSIRRDVRSGSRASPSAIDVGLSISAMPRLRPRMRGGAICCEGPTTDSCTAAK